MVRLSCSRTFSADFIDLRGQLYWGYIGAMEKKMETTIVYWGKIGIIYRDNGKEIGNYYSILG